MEAAKTRALEHKPPGKQRLKRALGAALVFCGLAAGAPSYAPPIPKGWFPQIRQHDQVMQRVWFPGRNVKTARQETENNLKNTRRLSLSSKAYIHFFLKKRRLRGLSRTPAEPNLPFPMFPNIGIFVDGPEQYHHEWIHHNGQASRNHWATADALSTYTRVVSTYRYSRMREAIPPRLAIRGNKVEYTFEGCAPNSFDVGRINNAFRKVNFGQHCEEGSEGDDLGTIARVEEGRLKKPGLGHFLIREVSRGVPLKRALEKIRTKQIEQERIRLVRENPQLDWLQTR